MINAVRFVSSIIMYIVLIYLYIRNIWIMLPKREKTNSKLEKKEKKIEKKVWANFFCFCYMFSLICCLCSTTYYWGGIDIFQRTAMIMIAWAFIIAVEVLRRNMNKRVGQDESIKGE